MIVDFTKPMWGHAIHGETMREVKASKLKDRVVDRLKDRRRYSVMIHSSERIKQGDSIVYVADRGTITAEVAAVQWCRDPRDMATIEIVITPSAESGNG